MSKISKKYKEEVLDYYGINIDSSDRLAKKIVNKYTTVDEEGYLNICWAGKCHETDVWVDKDFLIDELNYNWKKLTNHKGLYDHFLDIMIDELGFDIDFSMIVFVNFVLPEIYDVYFKPLEPDYINESMNRNKNNTIKEQINISNEDREFMFRTYKEMGLDEEWAQYDLEELLKWLDTLPEKIILYRLLYIDDDNIINREELGGHYTQEKESLLHNHYSKGSIYGGHWGNPVLLTVEADKDQIDILNTLHNNILYPHEEEITLKNKGRGVEFIKVEKL